MASRCNDDLWIKHKLIHRKVCKIEIAQLEMDVARSDRGFEGK